METDYKKQAETWADLYLSQPCVHISSIKRNACNRCLMQVLLDLAELKFKFDAVIKSNLKHLFVMKRLFNSNINSLEEKEKPLLPPAPKTDTCNKCKSNNSKIWMVVDQKTYCETCYEEFKKIVDNSIGGVY